MMLHFDELREDNSCIDRKFFQRFSSNLYKSLFKHFPVFLTFLKCFFSFIWTFITSVAYDDFVLAATILRWIKDVYLQHSTY